MIHPGVSHSMAGRGDPARHRSSHEWAQFPLPTRCCAQLAVEEINSAGGIGGRKIAITSGDSQGTPVEGVSATRRLIDLDKVDFIIGDVSSSVTLAMQPVVEDAGVLLLNAASSNPKITYAAGVGGFKWTFRNYPTDESRALIVVIQYAVEKRGFTKFAVLSVDSDYRHAAVDFTKKYLPGLKGAILTEDYYREGEVDFRSVLARFVTPGLRPLSCTAMRTRSPHGVLDGALFNVGCVSQNTDDRGYDVFGRVYGAGPVVAATVHNPDPRIWRRR